jgi:hypothetical protein
MQAVNDLGEIMQGAEQAADRGDHAGAERLLRQALSLQETTVGAQHPDVARTLNNLAIVCEMNGKLDDAENCYRRAYAIAIARLPLGDPFISTSRKNLEEFCAARGVPVKQASPPASSFRSESAPARPAPPGATSAVQSPRRASVAVAATREPSRVLAIALGLAALVVLIALGWFLIETNPDQARTPSAPAAAPSSSSAAPTPASSTPAQTPEPATPAPPAASAVTEPAPPAAPLRETEVVASAPAPAAEPPASATRRLSVNVVTAQVCSSLARGAEWRCTAAGADHGAGTFYFYTRVASPVDTLIEHRWYREGRLYQRVPLRIGANPNGFRTYSQTTVTGERAGIWKVEIGTPDGAVLGEQTFTVR